MTSKSSLAPDIAACAQAYVSTIQSTPHRCRSDWTCSLGARAHMLWKLSMQLHPPAGGFGADRRRICEFFASTCFVKCTHGQPRDVVKLRTRRKLKLCTAVGHRLLLLHSVSSPKLPTNTQQISDQSSAALANISFIHLTLARI